MELFEANLGPFLVFGKRIIGMGISNINKDNINISSIKNKT